MKCYANLGVVALAAALAAGCETTGPTVSSTSSPAPSGNEAVKNTVELQGLREELALLRNEVELQKNQLDKLLERQRNLYDDLDYRLRQQERAAGAAITTTQPPAGTASLGTSNTGSGFPNTPQPDVTGATTPPGGTGQAAQGTVTGAAATSAAAIQGMTPTGQGAAPTQPVPTQQAAIATPQEQAAYDEAFNLLKQSRYQESVTSFRQQLAQHPNGALADDAQYWIGEAMYVTRDFQGGLTAFETVVNRYPESARVAEAMLKLGYIQYELGAKEEARQTFTQVVNRFPGSRVAISAQTRLRKLQAEGG